MPLNGILITFTKISYKTVEKGEVKKMVAEVKFYISSEPETPFLRPHSYWGIISQRARYMVARAHYPDSSRPIGLGRLFEVAHTHHERSNKSFSKMNLVQIHQHVCHEHRHLGAHCK